MSKVVDLTGKRFGSLTVISQAKSSKSGRAMWLCRCDCGTEKIILGSSMIQGKTKSCGCSQVKPPYSKRLKNVWWNIKRRCYDERSDSFVNYGARGIGMCDLWRYDFYAFQDWAFQSGYDEHAPQGVCTIERIDNNKGYSPDNCRWATAREQANNRRNNFNVTFYGKTKTVSDWARELGLDKTTLLFRLKNKMWTTEEAMTVPVVVDWHHFGHKCHKVRNEAM